MSTINERLFDRLKELGMTQAELARKIDLTKGAINQWKKGASSPNGENLLKVAKALKVSPDWLATGKGPKEASEAAKVVTLSVMPVVTWEKEEDLKEHGDYVFVPRVDIKADCGDGTCVLHEEVLDQRQSFRAEWFAQRGLKPEHCVCIYATGDSMEPRIFEGDSLMIDRSPAAKERIIDGKIYLIRYGDDIRVKQLFKRYDGGLIIRSFNREKYPDEEIPAEELQKGHIEILGRVVWVSGEL